MEKRGAIQLHPQGTKLRKTTHKEWQKIYILKGMSLLMHHSGRVWLKALNPENDAKYKQL